MGLNLSESATLHYNGSPRRIHLSLPPSHGAPHSYLSRAPRPLRPTVGFHSPDTSHIYSGPPFLRLKRATYVTTHAIHTPDTVQLVSRRLLSFSLKVRVRWFAFFMSRWVHCSEDHRRAQAMSDKNGKSFEGHRLMKILEPTPTATRGLSTIFDLSDRRFLGGPWWCHACVRFPVDCSAAADTLTHPLQATAGTGCVGPTTAISVSTT